MTRRVAVVGATGAVGRELLGILAQRRFPVGELRLFASEPGARLPWAGVELPVRGVDAQAFAGVDLAFFCAPADVARRLVPQATAAGALVIDHSSAFRDDPRTPLVVPEVNGATAERHVGRIANPNCSTILLVLALAPLCALGRIERVVVATYQAVSGAGTAGLAELDGPPAAPPRVFPRPIHANVIPLIGGVDAAGDSGEERKVRAETRRILDLPELPVAATCVRVPVRRAHSEAVVVQFDRPVDPAAARALLRGAPGVLLQEDAGAGAYPTPRDAEGRDEVLVGRVRRDGAFEHGLALFLAGDQLRKGAALNAVQIAELAGA